MVVAARVGTSAGVVVTQRLYGVTRFADQAVHGRYGFAHGWCGFTDGAGQQMVR